MFGVVPEFLNAALDGMLDESGSVESYVTDKVGLSEAEMNRIRTRYLED
jgi:protein tyrosine/serine phosphatase